MERWRADQINRTVVRSEDSLESARSIGHAIQALGRGAPAA
jgi:hypothetical protein